MSRRAGAFAVVVAALVLVDAAAARPTTPIRHFITLMQENHSFDNYFGNYPGADGRPKGTCQPADPARPKAGCVRPYPIGRHARGGGEQRRQGDEQEPRDGSQLEIASEGIRATVGSSH